MQKSLCAFNRPSVLRLYCPILMPAENHPLQRPIEAAYANMPAAGTKDASQARQVFNEFRAALTRGEIRAAIPANGQWQVNAWVKQGILLGFRLGELTEMGDPQVLSFVDKDTFPARQFRFSDRVRIVPGGSSVREGAYVAPGVVC